MWIKDRKNGSADVDDYNNNDGDNDDDNVSDYTLPSLLCSLTL